MSIYCSGISLHRWRLLPQKIKCGKCDEILYNGTDIEPPSEIMRKFDGLCPKCGRKLNFEIDKVNIIPLINDENPK